MIKQLFSETTLLARFMLRRDRVRYLIFGLLLILITVLVAQAFVELYPTAEDRQVMAETLLNPAMVAMVGPAYGIGNYTIGAMFAHEMLLFSAITFALVSIIFVVRHTRRDEEDGRVEMIRALPTGRLSTLTAAVSVVSGVNLVIAILTGFSLYVLNIKSMGLEGSLLYGAALGATGIFFTALTAVFVQLSESSRSVIGYALTGLGIAYLIRAVGDVGDTLLSWFSPLGWVLGAEVYVNNYWWPIFLTIGAAMLLTILALYLTSIRDVGAGFIAAKPGRAYASSLLGNPFFLFIRLQRTSLIAWAIGMFILGVSYGSVFGDLESFFSENELLQEMLAAVEGFSLVDQFLPMIMSVMAMIGTIPAIMVMNKVIGEEKKNRIDHLLSRAVSRLSIVGSSVIISGLTSFIMISLAVIGLWSSGSISMDDELAFSTFYRAGIVYFPATLIMTGLATCLVGILPRLTSLIWGYLIYSFIVVYFGSLMDIPNWMINLSPFGHVPQVPVEDINILTISLLILVAMLLTVIGFFGYRKRDIE